MLTNIKSYIAENFGASKGGRNRKSFCLVLLEVRFHLSILTEK